jgi:hypothetical protein
VTTYTHDLAVSAVPYDSILVTELFAQLTPRLRGPLFWAGRDETANAGLQAPIVGDSARLVLVLYQQLWGRDVMTKADDVALRLRMRRDPKSVCVIRLDDTPLPSWLAGANSADFNALGLDGAAEFAVQAVSTLGGSPHAAAAPEPPPEVVRGWREGPPAFLAQPRAQAALRRELDELAAEIRPRLKAEEERGADRIVELHALPNRLIARIADVAVSFSWVNGGMGTVADGRLLVIQWQGLDERVKGVRALGVASQGRERIYHVEGTDAASWAWRADSPNGRASTTANLVAEWLEGAAIAPAQG